MSLLEELKAKGLGTGDTLIHSERSITFTDQGKVKTIIEAGSFRTIFGGNQHYTNVTLLPDESAIIGIIEEIELMGACLSPTSWRIFYAKPEGIGSPTLDSFHIEPSNIVRFIDE